MNFIIIIIITSIISVVFDMLADEIVPLIHTEPTSYFNNIFSSLIFTNTSPCCDLINCTALPLIYSSKMYAVP